MLTAVVLATTALAGVAFHDVAAGGVGTAETARSTDAPGAQIELPPAGTGAAAVGSDAGQPPIPVDAPVDAPVAGRVASPTPKLSAPGFELKLRGRVQVDAGYVGNPDDRVVTDDLGYRSKLRRARLGLQGSLPGGFSYLSGVEFAGMVAVTDLYLSWKSRPEAKLSFTVGQHFPFQGLEQITSANFGTLLERAQFTEAFGYTRRLGLSANYADGDLRVDVGAFGRTISAGFDGDATQLAARVTYAPAILGGRLHLGASYQHREFQTDIRSFRYRVRPGTRLTEVRFVDTGAVAATGDRIVGLEGAFVRGPVHFAAEAQHAAVRAVDRQTSDPGFFGGYAEVGLFLTRGGDGVPDTRGYGAGRFDRVRPRNPVGKGGLGAVQVNARIDYLDLSDDREIDGGESLLYSTSLIWTPIDSMRAVLQYSRQSIAGGPRAMPSRSPESRRLVERRYDVDLLALRMQFDF